MFKKVKDELSMTAVLLEEIMNGGLHIGWAIHIGWAKF